MEEPVHWRRVAAFPYLAAMETEVSGLQHRMVITPWAPLFVFLPAIQSLVSCALPEVCVVNIHMLTCVVTRVSLDCEGNVNSELYCFVEIFFYKTQFYIQGTNEN
jgi:hypothetical protein